jgi:four helix bundle protein
MNNINISIQDRTQKFAIRAIKAYTEINNKNNFNSAASVLSKQFLRATTSIGANCSEAKYAQSKKDFLSKYLIALKEANESRYWINLLIKSNSVPEHKFKPLLNELTEIINILVATTKKLKE